MGHLSSAGGGGDNGGFHRPWVAPEWLVRTDRSSHGFYPPMLGKKRCFALSGRDIAGGPTAR